MTADRPELSMGWELEPIRIQLELAELMADLDPRWDDWAGLEVANA